MSGDLGGRFTLPIAHFEEKHQRLRARADDRCSRSWARSASRDRVQRERRAARGVPIAPCKSSRFTRRSAHHACLASANSGKSRSGSKLARLVHRMAEPLRARPIRIETRGLRVDVPNLRRSDDFPLGIARGDDLALGDVAHANPLAGYWTPEAEREQENARNPP